MGHDGFMSSEEAPKKLTEMSYAIPDLVSRAEHFKRVLLFGPPGIGKSTLASAIAAGLAVKKRGCWCVSADPGSPGFGLPGVISLGKWEQNGWAVKRIEALCSLDAGRFRLPLIMAVQRLMPFPQEDIVIVDSPGVSRGIAGKELLQSLVDAAQAKAVFVLTHAGRDAPLLNELRGLSAQVFIVHASPAAMRPGKRSRSRQRTEQWNRHLADAVQQRIDLHSISPTGTPPPLDIPETWTGRQIALLHQGQTVAVGEAQQLADNTLTVKIPLSTESVDTLLVRDACRNTEGLLESAAPFLTEHMTYIPPTDMHVPITESGGPRIIGRVGSVDVELVNGVFGDPLLHIRLRHQRRSMLFDLGDGHRLPARIAHQVSDVFITHAHMDHIGGFLWLLRSRIGQFPVCRLYGPPGLKGHIEGFTRAILWDRVAERAPQFQINEIHEQTMYRYLLKVGEPSARSLEEIEIHNGIIFRESEFRIRATTLDHGTPVIAYALEPEKQLNIRKDKLTEKNLPPGKWLGEVKQYVLAENYTATITLPNGERDSIQNIARELVLITPGKNLVYATDFRDNTDNRQRIVALANNAHTFFCESSFVMADIEQAKRTGHLTTRACAEIGAASNVARLVPFHFSQRYADDPERVYEELMAFSERVVAPRDMTVFDVLGAMELEPDEN